MGENGVARNSFRLMSVYWPVGKRSDSGMELAGRLSKGGNFSEKALNFHMKMQNNKT